MSGSSIKGRVIQKLFSAESGPCSRCDRPGILPPTWRRADLAACRHAFTLESQDPPPPPLKKRPGSSRISMILAGMPRRESHGPRAERRSSKSSTAASPSTAALAEVVPGCRALGHLPEPFESMKG